MTAGDIQVFRNLIIGRDKEGEKKIDFDEGEWSKASLMTPRHLVRIMWNELAVQKMCTRTGRQLLVCAAEDTIDGRPATLEERYCIAARGHSKRKQRSKDLPWSVDLAIGMKVLVTNHLETDLDITNGARGTIIDIVLHADETALGNQRTVKLKCLPAYILVKMD